MVASPSLLFFCVYNSTSLFLLGRIESVCEQQWEGSMQLYLSSEIQNNEEFVT